MAEGSVSLAVRVLAVDCSRYLVEFPRSSSGLIHFHEHLAQLAIFCSSLLRLRSPILIVAPRCSAIARRFLLYELSCSTFNMIQHPAVCLGSYIYGYFSAMLQGFKLGDLLPATPVTVHARRLRRAAWLSRISCADSQAYVSTAFPWRL